MQSQYNNYQHPYIYSNYRHPHYPNILLAMSNIDELQEIGVNDTIMINNLKNRNMAYAVT